MTEDKVFATTTTIGINAVAGIATEVANASVQQRRERAQTVLCQIAVQFPSKAMTMKLSLMLITLCMIVCAGPLQASQPCMMVALQDTHAVESPDSVWKRGVRDGPVTQYVINHRTGVKSFCLHGGYCYAAWVRLNGQLIEALRLTDCRIQPGDAGSNEGDETIFGLEAVPAHVPDPPAPDDSVKDIKGVPGSCTEDSYTAEGPVSDDISDRNRRFYCDAAALFFMDTQNKRITIRFFDSEHLKMAPVLGFAGVMKEDGTTLAVTSMYYIDPNGAAHQVGSDSFCALDFVKPNLTGIACVAYFISRGRKYVGMVNFHAAAQ